MGDIHLTEYGEQEVTLCPSDVAALRRPDLSGALEVLPTFEQGRYRVRAGSQVGFVRLPGGSMVAIEPKVPVETLFALLAKVYDPEGDVFRNAAQKYTTVEALFEFVVGIFVKEVGRLAERGLLHGYQKITDDTVSIRGRILMSETLRRHPVLRDRHWCAYTHFTPDVSENRILGWTCKSLQAGRYRDDSMARRLRRVLRLFAGVTLDPGARALFRRLAFHRLNEHYRTALALAQLILAHLTYSGTVGEAPFFAYLVDVEWLFEQYVSVALSECLRPWNTQAAKQEEHPFDTAGTVRVWPDIVLYSRNGGRPLLVVDAKYKRDAAQQDLNQVLAYCHILGLEHAVLLRPAHQGAPTSVVEVKGHPSIKIHNLSLCLQGGPEQLDDAAEGLASELAALARQ